MVLIAGWERGVTSGSCSCLSNRTTVDDEREEPVMPTVGNGSLPTNCEFSLTAAVVAVFEFSATVLCTIARDIWSSTPCGITRWGRVLTGASIAGCRCCCDLCAFVVMVTGAGVVHVIGAASVLPARYEVKGERNKYRTIAINLIIKRRSSNYRRIMA